MLLGADLSSIHEVEDSGGVFYHQGLPADLIEILTANGANIARVRLWHTPTWTSYSTLDDAKRTMRRARDAGMALMLDFHYSDTWADPAKQIIPAAWASICDPELLSAALHDYTLTTLIDLHACGLMPEFVQVGNEINTELLMPGYHDGAVINWPRNALLINAGLAAVREAGRRTGTTPRSVLHIAQPENLEPWFEAAFENGVSDFDEIGLSYYPKWSICSLYEMGQAIAAVKQRWGKPIMIVETAYPWTLEPGRVDDHLLGPDAVVPAYPATAEGQRQFLIDLAQITVASGGTGVIYWEPAWISTAAKPTHWENATLFDYEGRALNGIEFFAQGVQP